MTTPIVPVATWGASLLVPQDLEPANAASLALFVQELANRIEYAKLNTPTLAPTGTPIRLPVQISSVGANSNWVITGTPAPLATTLFTGANPLLLPLPPLVAGCLIRSFNVVFIGATGHGGLPATMPKVELVNYNSSAVLGSAGALPETILDSQVDTSPNVAAFQLWHNIGKTLGSPAAYNPTAAWYLKVTSETGANALAGAFACFAHIEVSSINA